MAFFWASKAPSDVVERVWTPKAGEPVASKTLTVSTGTATLASEIQGEDVIVTVTGGASAVTQIITASAVLENGETITETIYIPVIVTTSAAATVEDIISFALRKVFGLGQTPPDDAAQDAIERLADMLRVWRTSGADIGAPDALDTATVIYCPNDYLSAVKHNLILEIADNYGLEVGLQTVTNANRGLQHIKQKNLPDDRGKSVYY